MDLGTQLMPGPIVKANLVDEADPDGGPTPPGSFSYFVDQSGQTAGMIFRCPCGCAELAAIEFDHVPIKPPPDIHRWHWNGDRARPSLTPSLAKTAGCMWHGYLTDGEFRPV